MQVSVNAKALAAAAAAVGRVVERRVTIPILGNMLLSAAGETLSLTATDLDVAARVDLPAAVEVEGATTIPAALFADIVGNMPENAEIAIAAGDEARATISSGHSRVTLPTLPDVDFPPVAAEPPESAIDLTAADAAVLFERPFVAVSVDDSRPYLQGICLEQVDGVDAQLIAVATNGHTLIRETVRGISATGKRPVIICPIKACRQIIVMAKSAKALRIDWDDRRIVIAGDGMTLSSKLVDATFPDWRRLIPVDQPTVADVDAAAFIAALKRVLPVANTTKGRGVKLSFTEGNLELSARGKDSDVRDDIAVDYDGEKFEIGANGRYLSEIGTAADSDTIHFEMGSGGPIVLTVPGRETFTGLVMPMRL